MASSLHQWESDPLFSAAEVVQDSADRMESVFRSLLHELSLVQGDRPDPKLHVSIDYHKRDLATTLETAKWQLEDFERAVAGRSQNREDVISRHKQFIGAMREQILYVEKSLEGTPIGDPPRNTEWVNLNEQDRDGLALFLSGGNNAEPTDGQEVEDSSILRRFLDPTTSSAKDSTSGIVEHKSREIEDLNTNGVVHVDRVIESRKENNLGKVGSYNRFGEGGSWDIGNTRLTSDFTDSFPQTSCNRYGGGESRDLEANEAKPESFSRTNELGFLNTAWSVYGSRVTGSYTKRFKDGEEQSHSPSIADVSHGARVQHQGTWARYERSPHHIQVQRHSIHVVLIILLTLIILVSWISSVVITTGANTV
ncbi:hypothetical protein D8674_009051 [Pyrus ussuriensis x Pyrus communis]|uniref:Syntaxin 6/10/61 N-terminal domain-containing protein n=1 Tax=Pyrus ussuriensis x Pyrus communis TaxID=2448454 RepID=A0A5N5HZI9_9ROSA|nr:hypothetical protein D8674_009051 [Pyrus ussuriensis x Pyrus communis]